MAKLRWISILLTLAVVLAVPGRARAERVRDMADVAGARENQLVGYGLVTGLNGTGDDITVPFTAQSLLSMLRRLGIQADPQMMYLRNVAAVMVTANIPAFAKQGTKMDVTVSSIGNARSLNGGVLVQTVLKGPDQHAYAVAQGPLVIGGFAAKGLSGTSLTAGTTNTGRIAEGAIVEREIPATIVANGQLRLELRTPGFAVASRIAEAVNKKFGQGTASAADGGAVDVHIPQAFQARVVDYIAQLEDLEITPVRRARVVINERTGTIVAGGDVRLSPAAVVHGSLTIVVKETPTVSQPTAPFGQGTTMMVPNTEIQAGEGSRALTYVPAAPTLADVTSALGALGLTPRELASVLQALREAGALEAEVVVQ